MRGVEEVGVSLNTYVVSFPKALHTVKFPVTGCIMVAHSVGRLQEHFTYLHFLSKVVVFQEGEEPLPCSDFCGVHIPAGHLIKHRQT